MFGCFFPSNQIGKPQGLWDTGCGEYVSHWEIFEGDQCILDHGDGFMNA